MDDTSHNQELHSVLASIINTSVSKELFLLGNNSIESIIISINPKIQLIKIDQYDIQERKSFSADCLVIMNNLFDAQFNTSFLEPLTHHYSEILIIQDIVNPKVNLDDLQNTILKIIDFGYANQLDIPLIVGAFYIAHFKPGINIDRAKHYELALLPLSERIIKQRQLLIQLRRNDSKLMAVLNIQQDKIEQEKQELSALQIENGKLRTELQEILKRAEYAEEQWLFWKTKWVAFENSRSWNFLCVLQKIKNLVLSPARLIKKILHLGQLSLIVIRSQGYRRFMALVKQRILQIPHQNQKMPVGVSSLELNRQISEIAPINKQLPLAERSDFVDIIVCAHNALEDVRKCLESLVINTTPPYRILLVDDGSDEATKAFLEKFQSENQSFVSLFRSDKPTGYTFAANRGIKASTAPFVVLINSDTIVTSQWLDRMLSCMKSEMGIGVVGPLSNTASWQSVPYIEDNGDWALNPLPEGISIDQMGRIVAESSGRLYPHMPFLNGFCLLINRELINDIGYFDEQNFGPGYGEEDDFILRARKSNWKTVLADDVYIYHAQSRSYSSERRKVLSEKAGKVLKEKHGEGIILNGVKYCQSDRVLEGIRARVAVAIIQYKCINDGSKFAGKKILFILPVSSPGGGANVVVSESLLMMKMGVQVDFYNLKVNKDQFVASYPDLPIKVIYGNIADLNNIMGGYDAVIATYNPSVGWIKNNLHSKKNPIIGYYVQGYEPLMYPNESYDYFQAVNSYSLIDKMVLFTKTQWTQRIVIENTRKDTKVVGISVNISLFRPRPRKFFRRNGAPLRIMAMVRPEAPYRQPYETMQLLKLAADKYRDKVDICIFGTDFNNPGFSDLPQNFSFRLFGILPQQKVAALLNEADIFIDFSSHQAMGLTALEAMACGAAVIVPENGGAVEFARHEKNSLVFKNNDLYEVWSHLQRLVEDDHFRITLQRFAIRDTCSYFPEKATLNILKALFGEIE